MSKIYIENITKSIEYHIAEMQEYEAQDNEVTKLLFVRNQIQASAFLTLIESTEGRFPTTPYKETIENFIGRLREIKEKLNV